MNGMLGKGDFLSLPVGWELTQAGDTDGVGLWGSTAPSRCGKRKQGLPGDCFTEGSGSLVVSREAKPLTAKEEGKEMAFNIPAPC